MKNSIRIKFVAVCLFSMFLTVASISTVSYFLVASGHHQEFQERIRLAFHLILSSYTNRVTPETDLDLLSGRQWNFEGLRGQILFESEIQQQMVPCEDIFSKKEDVTLSPVTFNNQEYYQGRCALKNVQGKPGTLTVRLLKDRESQQLHKILMAMLVISGLSLSIGFVFVFIASGRIVRPMTTFRKFLHRLAQGEVQTVLGDPSYTLSKQMRWRKGDEVGLLYHSLFTMTTYLQDITGFAEHFARGEITQILPPRSERDVVGHAFYDMSKYVSNMASVATIIANGDLRQEFQPISDRDILGTAFHKMRDLRQIMSQINDGSQQLRQASNNLAPISTQMASDAEQASQKVHLVSATSQQINELVENIAMALEEFSASIQEISHNTFEVTSMITKAVDLANSAQETIANLETQSQEIGVISKVITSITQQTNLLALNAAIEAARAGETGRGFTVVAHEVKALAKETAISAEDITHKIVTIQAGSQNAVNAIREVSSIISQIHDLSGAIVTSVEQQSATTNEITRNVNEAAIGTREVTESITTVAAITQNTSTIAIHVQQAAQELNLLADQLQQLTIVRTHGNSEEFLSYYQQANINWKAYEGTHLAIGLNKHPFTNSLRPLLQIFEQLTGIRVTYTILPEEEYFEKLFRDFSNGRGIFDVYMTSPVFEWRYQYAGWIEDLNPYYHNSALTDQRWYKRDDFFTKVLQANMWDGTIGGGLGKGRWNGIPVIVEFYNQAFREDLRQKWDLPVPATYPELFNVLVKAAELGQQEIPQVHGIAERGIKSWSTVHSGYLTAFSSYGQRDLTPDLHAAINTPEGVNITKIWIDLLQKAGKLGWEHYTWEDITQNFAAGKFYEILDADLFASLYDNPTTSRVAGKVGYSLPPAGPDGTIKSNMWTWSLGMSTFSKQKEAAWLFLLWATAPRTILEATLKFENFNPTRRSVWQHPHVVEKTAQWGSKPGQYREIFEALSTKYGEVAWTPNPDVTTLGDIWAEALRQAYKGQDVQQALDGAAEKIDALMAKWRRKSA